MGFYARECTSQRQTASARFEWLPSYECSLAGLCSVPHEAELAKDT